MTEGIELNEMSPDSAEHQIESDGRRSPTRQICHRAVALSCAKLAGAWHPTSTISVSRVPLRHSPRAQRRPANEPGNDDAHGNRRAFGDEWWGSTSASPTKGSGQATWFQMSRRETHQTPLHVNQVMDCRSGEYWREDDLQHDHQDHRDRSLPHQRS